MGSPKPDKFTRLKPESNGSTTAFIVTVGTIVIIGCILIFANTANHMRAQGGSADDSLQSRVKQATTNMMDMARGAMPEMPRLDRKMNILVMGVDWNGDDAERYVGTRSDTMMVVSLDPDKNKVSIVSIPRDSRVLIPRGHGVNKINSAHALGGPDLAVRTVKENFNIPIDNYAVVDTRGLTELFSLLGPFKVMVEKEMHYHDKTAHLDIDLMPGEQELQAKELVGYLRFRHDAMADIGRMERQQWFLRQALDKVKDPSILLKAPQLIKVGYDSINTDLSLDEIASIFSFGKDLKTKDLITATLPGHSETIEEVNYLVLSDAGSRAIFSKLGFNDDDEHSYRRERYRSKLADEDLETKRKRIRISLKCAAPMSEYAEFLSEVLKEKGWRVRYTLKTGLDDCRHAQLNLNHTRVSNEAVALLKDDLPLVKNWPVVIKYGAIMGSDIVLVIPNQGGISRWYQASKEEDLLTDIPESEPQGLKLRQASAGYSL
ncbi:hypothetical protein GC174_12575 [bacterium]|nr:hypothetical protein [bacterium]